MNAVLACDVFLEEIESLQQSGEIPKMTVEWLEMGLHDRPDELRANVQEKIFELDSGAGVESILLAYGLCGNGLLGIRAGKCPLRLPRSHDCISILLGGIDAHAAVLKKEPGTYFYSPGWIRNHRVPGPDRDAHLREVYSAKYADDPEMLEELIEVDQETYGHHKQAAYVDLTDNRDAEDYCKNCAKHLGWDFLRLKGQPAFLKGLLTGPWPSEQFLTVPPGATICMEADSTLAARFP